jgi:hypothetical protein
MKNDKFVEAVEVNDTVMRFLLDNFIKPVRYNYIRNGSTLINAKISTYEIVNILESIEKCQITEVVNGQEVIPDDEELVLRELLIFAGEGKLAEFAQIEHDFITEYIVVTQVSEEQVFWKVRVPKERWDFKFRKLKLAS